MRGIGSGNDSKGTKKSRFLIPKKKEKSIIYKIRLLDDAQSPIEYQIKKEDIAQDIFDRLCEDIGGLIEKEYFGLRYTDHHGQRHWIEMDKNIMKQMKSAKYPGLCFRVKHYPIDPEIDLKQDLAKYYLYLQLRRDLIQGRLICQSHLVSKIGALICQAELGDAPSQSNDSGECSSRNEIHNYVSSMKLFYSQTPLTEAQIIEAHKELRGMPQEEAEINLLRELSQLPSYGVDRFPVVPLHKVCVPSTLPNGANTDPASGDRSASSVEKLPKGTPFYMGITAKGLSTFIGLQRNQAYNWDQIERVGCDGRTFMLYLKNVLQNKSTLLTYRCESNSAALALWCWTLDRKSFFTLQKGKEAKKIRSGKNLLRRNHTHMFSGRSQKELQASLSEIEDLPQPSFTRVSSLRRAHEMMTVKEKTMSLGRAVVAVRQRPKLEFNHRSLEIPELDDDSDIIPAGMDKPVTIPDTVFEQPLEEDIDQAKRPEGETSSPSKVRTTINCETSLQNGPTLVVEEPLLPSSIEEMIVPTKLAPSSTEREESFEKQPNHLHQSNELYLSSITALQALDNSFAEETIQSTSNDLKQRLPHSHNDFDKVSKKDPTSANGHASKIKEHNTKQNGTCHEHVDARPEGETGERSQAALFGVAAVIMMLSVLFVLETDPNNASELLAAVRKNSIVSSIADRVYIPMRNAIFDVFGL